MQLIASAKTDKIAEYLYDVAISSTSLENIYYENDMNEIANSKNDKEAKKKYINVINRLQNKTNNSNKNNLSNEEKINKIYENAIKYVDGDKTKEIPSEAFTLK